jgi:hypothetical protein
LGLRIVERRGGTGVARCVISEYHTRSKTIVLYRDSLELLVNLVRERRLPFDPAMLDEIAIAHECAHVRFPKAREADAHAFAQELLGLAASPQLLESALASYLPQRSQ